MPKQPYIIVCPECHTPIELRHIPGKPTIEAVRGPKPEPISNEPPELVDDDVSAIHKLIDEGAPE